MTAREEFVELLRKAMMEAWRRGACNTDPRYECLAEAAVLAAYDAASQPVAGVETFFDTRAVPPDHPLALLRAATPKAEPAGWVLVLARATAAMFDAFHKGHARKDGSFDDAYAAMIQAAPTHDAAGAEKDAALTWSDPAPPQKDGPHYDHVIAQTPFGRFLITWKGWKDYDCPTIDETPWGEWGGVGRDLDEAKQIAEAEYRKRLRAAMSGAGKV